jgi:hypothetical protein
MPKTTTAPETGSQMLGAEQVLAIAQADAIVAYQDLSPFRICLALESDGWHIDYEIKEKGWVGGGPHYVIDPCSGAIVSKKYEQ